MYFFDKKTMYLIWKMEEGQARGVGTVRFLVMDEVCRLEVVITACGKVQGTYPVYVISGNMQSLLGEILLNKGRGTLSVKCNANRLGHLAFPYTQVTGLHIDLKSEGCLEQKWLPVQAQKVEVQNRTEKKGREEESNSRAGELKHCSDNVESPENPEQKEWTRNQFARKEKSDSEKVYSMQREKAGREEPRSAQKEKAQLVPNEKPIEQIHNTKQNLIKPPQKEEFQLYQSKWQQLCAIYPVVHPFGDGRAYLSIEPRDFVILQEQFQPMVQNSFLLHGFYHYRHLLLGRKKQGNYIQYYLGVPGVFYEKEKSAALFYGFESFEGAVTPTPEGSFGYYMKRVQI